MRRRLVPVVFPGPVAILRSLRENRRGATALEYALILALVVLTMMVGLGSLSSVTIGLWNGVNSNVQHLS